MGRSILFFKITCKEECTRQWKHGLLLLRLAGLWASLAQWSLAVFSSWPCVTLQSTALLPARPEVTTLQKKTLPTFWKAKASLCNLWSVSCLLCACWRPPPGSCRGDEHCKHKTGTLWLFDWGHSGSWWALQLQYSLQDFYSHVATWKPTLDLSKRQ